MPSSAQNQPEQDSGKQFYTLREASAKLNVSEKTVRRWVNAGRLRKCPDIRKVLIACDDVDNFAKRHATKEWEP